MDDKAAINENIITAIDLIRSVNKETPNVETILSVIQQGDPNMDSVLLKDALIKLVESNVIYNGGIDGKEIYFINKELDISAQVMDGSTLIGPSVLEKAETIINEKFYDILIDKIRSEVQKELININNLSDQQRTKHVADNPKDSIEHVASLQGEIFFLKQELVHKNKVIELLLKETINNVLPNGSTKDLETGNAKNVSMKERIEIYKAYSYESTVIQTKIMELLSKLTEDNRAVTGDTKSIHLYSEADNNNEKVATKECGKRREK